MEVLKCFIDEWLKEIGGCGGVDGGVSLDEEFFVDVKVVVSDVVCVV